MFNLSIFDYVQLFKKKKKKRTNEKKKIFLKIKMLFQMNRLFSGLACVGNANKKSA